jgi:hypothetical protein
VNVTSVAYRPRVHWRPPALFSVASREIGRDMPANRLGSTESVEFENFPCDLYMGRGQVFALLISCISTTPNSRAGRLSSWLVNGSR